MGQPNFPQTPAVSVAFNLTPTHNSTATTVYTAPSDKSVMAGRIRATSTDTVAVNLQFSRTIGGVTVIIGEVQIPAGAGTNGSGAWVDILDSINLGESMTLAPGEVLKIKPTTISSAKQIDIHIEGAPL
ncbi:MAG: hypothetical protein FD177_212 [Desulfovibrionaceae bacterium]|nr:MAG: hypothetical protein FD177_212 [Desulfovibrionaceae bacterium]